MIFKQLLIILFLSSFTSSIYNDNNSFLVHLNKNNFNHLVIDKPDFWLIEFYGKSNFFYKKLHGVVYVKQSHQNSKISQNIYENMGFSLKYLRKRKFAEICIYF